MDAFSSKRECLSNTLIVVGVVLIVVGLVLIFWHPLLNFAIEPEVVAEGGIRTWVVDEGDLTLQYDSDEANWDGTMSEIADGYLVAHDWSDYGVTIASEPERIEFKNESYAFDGVRYAKIGDSLADMRSWANAEGRIAFQTCTGEDDGVMVVRYRPVGDAV